MMMRKKFHLLSVIGLVVAFSTSCMQKPDLTEDDGPAVNPDTVFSTFSTAWGNASIMSIGLNEFSYLEKEITIATNAPRVTFQQGTTVQEITDEPNQKIFRLVRQIGEIGNDNQTRLSTSERTFSVDKTQTQIAVAQLKSDLKSMAKGEVTTFESATPLSIELISGLANVCYPDDNNPSEKVSCHNLRSWSEIEPAPSQISSRPGCENLPSCSWTKQGISFDLIVESEDEATKSKLKSKAHYTVKVSRDAPFLSRLTDYCFQGLGEYEGQKFPLKICQVVKNFQRGTP